MTEYPTPVGAVSGARSRVGSVRLPTGRRVGFAVLVLLGANCAVLAIVRLGWPAIAVDRLGALRSAFAPIATGAMNGYLVTLALVFAVDTVVLGWPRCALAGLTAFDRSARWDALFGVLAALGLLDVVVMLAGCSAYLVVAPWGVQHFGVVGVGSGWATWLHVVAYVVLFDLVNYWFHRWCHSFGRLWRLHRFHHEATGLLVLTGNRVHPWELVIRQWLLFVPMAALGTPLSVPVAIWFIRRTIDQLQHSMLPWTFGWAGRWLVFAPVGHRIHHSPLAVHRDTNFGDILTIWDRVFRTWYSGTIVNERVGLVEARAS